MRCKQCGNHKGKRHFKVYGHIFKISALSPSPLNPRYMAGRHAERKIIIGQVKERIRTLTTARDGWDKMDGVIAKAELERLLKVLRGTR